MENSGPDQPPSRPPNGVPSNSAADSTSDQPPTYDSASFNSSKYQPRKSVDLLDKKDLSPTTMLEVDNSNFLTNELNPNDYQSVIKTASQPTGPLSKSLPQRLTEATRNLYYTCAHCSYR